MRELGSGKNMRRDAQCEYFIALVYRSRIKGSRRNIAMGNSATPPIHSMAAPQMARNHEAERWRVFGAVALVYTLLIPLPFNFSVGTLLLPPYRLFLIGAAFVILRDILKGHLRLCLADYVVAALGVWIAISSIVTMGLDQAVQASGSLVLDIVVAYFWLRTTISSLRDLRILLVLSAPGLAMTGLIIGAESLLQMHLVMPAASAITGQVHELEPSIRLGLMRGQGPFPHPILAGIFLGSFLPLYLVAGLRGWPLWLGLFGGLCCVFTFSSGAFLVLASGLALVAANFMILRTSMVSWRLALLGLLVVIIFLEVASQSGVVKLITRFAALNNQTAFFRLLIWDEGIKTVVENPIFGIGFGDWARPRWMPPSVDNYWLVLAMRHGVIAPLLALLGVLLAVVGLARNSVRLATVDQNTIRGTAIALSVMCLGVFSVALWLSPQVWFFALLGIAASLVQHTAQSAAET